MRNILLACILFLSTHLWAEAVNDNIPMIKKQFLIVKSTKSYLEAKQLAEKLSQRLNIKLDLRNLQYHEKNFLTMPQKDCKSEEIDYPFYVPRGRYDDGIYISIEHSDNYENFKDGYYIVIAASGEDVKEYLKPVKEVIKDAYVKSSKVYMGCLH